MAEIEKPEGIYGLVGGMFILIASVEEKVVIIKILNQKEKILKL